MEWFSEQKHEQPGLRLADMPIAVLDTETTGVVPGKDRILDANISILEPKNGLVLREWNWLLNPNIPVPRKATAVNGITSKMVRKHGTDYAQGLQAIAAVLEDIWTQNYLLVAFNAAFDLTIIHAETQRLFQQPLMIREAIADPMIIDRHFDPDRSGPRTLVDQCKLYDIPLFDAHTAGADAVAAGRLAIAHFNQFQLWGWEPIALFTHQQQWFRERVTELQAYFLRRANEEPDTKDAQYWRNRAQHIDTQWPLYHLP